MRRKPAPLELLAAPVLEGRRYRGRPIYFSDVIVAADSPARSFADLRGHSWCYNDPNSHSGYNITRYHLVSLGETAGFFGRVVRAGSHQNSIRMVAAHEVDASAIDSQVLAVELRDHPELAKRVRVIGSLGPSPIQPVVASTLLPSALRARVRAALLSMGDDASGRRALAFGFVRRFVAVTDAEYDPIRCMVSAAEEAGFLTLR